MTNTESNLPAALPAIFTEKCLLLSDLRARELMTRVLRAGKPEQRIVSSEPPAPQTFLQVANVAIIPMVGILTKYPSFESWIDDYFGLCPAYGVIQQINAALADTNVSEIVLSIDSPGGFVNGSVELSDAVADANKIKPVIGYIHGLCCSGAYYIASQCSKIVARREAEVGNIGVYSVLTDVSKAWESMGVSMTLVASGQFKGLGADGKVSQDLIDDTKRIVTGLYEQFKQAVSDGRRLNSQQTALVSDGRAYLGPQAMELGLVDSLASSVAEVVSGSTKDSKQMSKQITAPKAGDATPPTTEEVKTELNAAITSANGHKDQARKTLDAYQTVAEPDAGTTEVAKQAATALRASSDASLQCAKALDGSEDDGDEDAQAFTATEYLSTFGDVGARWFIEKKPFAVSANEFITKLKSDHKTETDVLKAENADLKTKLSAIDRGNPSATFDVPKGEGTTGAQPTEATGMSENLQKYKASIKIPAGK